jgi:hypothetical protein
MSAGRRADVTAWTSMLTIVRDEAQASCQGLLAYLVNMAILAIQEAEATEETVEHAQATTAPESRSCHQDGGERAACGPAIAR